MKHATNLHGEHADGNQKLKIGSASTPTQASDMMSPDEKDETFYY